MTEQHAARVVGRRVRPYGWRARTAGTEPYVSDIDLGVPVLVGKIVRSPHAHALIESLQADEAERMPGVAAVVTARDLPPLSRYLHLGDAHADRHPLAVDRVRYVGEEVAAVAAETEALAERAATRVRVRYRPLPAPMTVEAALAQGAPTLHERASGEANVSSRLHGTLGDAEFARAAGAVSATGTFRYPRVAHACMEPNTTLASWDPLREILELWTSTQAPYFVVREVAHALGLDERQVVCREVAVGGGFGSRSKICEQEVIAAALSIKAKRPVRIALTRDEEFAATKPRHAFEVRLETSATRQGMLASFAAEILVDNGAYNHYGPTVMQVAVKKLGLLYNPLAVSWDARLVDTALPPGGQFRGYGTPQIVFAVESQVDEVAEQLDLDPVDFRLRNANLPGTRTLSGAKLGSARLRECLEAVRSEIGWDAKRAGGGSGRGVGVAVAAHGSGSYAFADANRSEAAVDLHGDGSVRIRFGGADPGTGQRTLLAQICCEELGVPLDAVVVEMMDSETTPFDMGSWSSRGTHMAGHAARQAARELRDRLLALGRAKLGSDDVVLEEGRVASGSDAIPIGDLVGLSPDARDGMLGVVATYVDPYMERYSAENTHPNFSASYTFAAHAVEVEVDTATGHIRVVDYVAAHDIGTALHPTQVEGQIIGGVVMGLGAALGEELRYAHGRLLNSAYINYALPRAADLPAIRTILIEGGDPAGPYGAKSVGEVSIVPPAPALANAVYHATGVRFRELPLTPDKVLTALASREGRSRTGSGGLWRRPSRWWIAGMRWLYPRGLHAALHRYGTRAARRITPTPVETVTMPVTLEEACGDVARESTAALGGGTDLLLQRHQGLANPRRLVSLSDVAELARLRESGRVLQIGAGVTLDRLEDGPVSERLPALAEAVRTIASPQVRGVATVAGNLLQEKRCVFFRNGFDCYKRGGPSCPCYAVLSDHRFYHAAMGAHRCQAVTPSDLATTLLALDATVDVCGSEHGRRIDMTEFYTGPGETTLRPDELVCRIDVPLRPLRRSTFEKLRLWEGDFAVVSAAVAADIDHHGRWSSVRIAIGALAPKPWRARRTEQGLEGRVVTGREVRRLLEDEVGAQAHPLPGNGWKLEAAIGLTARAAERLASVP